MSTEIFDDLEAEQARIEAILSGLAADTWLVESAAPGWSVVDVVLHLAQSEEAVALSAAGGLQRDSWRQFGASVDDAMAALVDADDSPPDAVFQRWRAARRSALAALRHADPNVALPWVASSIKPRTLATTRVAEHWAHGLDITAPLGIDYPDTARLRHIAWLGHSTLPYAMGLTGQAPVDVYCELIAPDGDIWRYGPPAAASSIEGSAAAFCRVGARRLTVQASGLVSSGPHGEQALRALRNYAS